MATKIGWGNRSLLQPAGRHLAWGNSSRRQSLSGKRAQGCRQRLAGGNRLSPSRPVGVGSAVLVWLLWPASHPWGAKDSRVGVKGAGVQLVLGLRPVPYVGPGVWQGVIFTPPAGSVDQKGRGSLCGRQRPACCPLVGPCEGSWGSPRLASCACVGTPAHLARSKLGIGL